MSSRKRREHNAIKTQNSESTNMRRESSAAYLTAKDLEALLQIDRKTIYGYVSAGTIPYVRIQSNLRFRKAEIEDWIEQQSYRPRRNGNGAKERQ